jgi:dihydroflavonol-4-reductase
MQVLVTGGTGYVGSHAVAALQQAGHRIRLLVRSPDRVGPNLSPLDVVVVELEIAAGDVMDPSAVSAAMGGCDAVVHSASIYSLDSRREAELRNVNVEGTRTVLEAAVRQGLDPIVYVSSAVSLAPARPGAPLGLDSPVRETPSPYGRSKAEAERLARRMQDEGAPITIVYPASVWGSRDPYVGEQHRLAAEILKGRLPLLPPGGLQIVDARDVGATIAAVMEPGKGPRRYLVPGSFLTMTQIAGMLAQATGRTIRARAAPAFVVRAFASMSEWSQRFRRGRATASREGIEWTLGAYRVDDSATRTQLGIEPRDPKDTIASTAQWLARDGEITPAQAGSLAATP